MTLLRSNFSTLIVKLVSPEGKTPERENTTGLAFVPGQLWRKSCAIGRVFPKFFRSIVRAARSSS